MSNLLQERINELNSAIINFVDDKVHITGFYNADRLESYLTNEVDNHSSKGLYPYKDVTFTTIKKNALFIIQNNGIEQYRIQYKPLFKGQLKSLSKTLEMVSIFKDNYSDQYIIKTEKRISEFENIDEIDLYLLAEYDTALATLQY